MHPDKWKKPCGARLFGQRKNANLCIKISVLLWRSGWDSNPRTRKGQQISSLPRYDRFDTTPYISSAALPGKSERTTGENRLFNSSLCCPQSLAASGFSRSRVPRRIHDFECCTFDHSDNSPKKMGPRTEDPSIIMPFALFCQAGNRNYSSEAMSTISMERRMNSVICSASSGWRDSSARS